MRCPKCASEESSVSDSRAEGEAIKRRRICAACDARFTTYERLELSMPAVIKKSGAREDFRLDKIRAGLKRACEKRPVESEIIDRAAESIERKVSELCVREISSRELGEFVMAELKGIDKIAYVRFASVYREFSQLEQFAEALEILKRNG